MPLKPQGSSQLSIYTSPQSSNPVPSISFIPYIPDISSYTHSTPTLSSSNLVAFSNEVALATAIPRQTEVSFEELVPESSTTLSPSSYNRLVYFPELTIPPYLRLDDAWKDIRELLPPPLQDVLQHYEYTTSLTLAMNDPAKAAWQSNVPEIARGHDFLVNCVLSVGYLHLGRIHEDQAEKRRMNALGAARMNKALLSYRLELENVTKENAAALFASSTLTAVYLFRTSALDIENLRASIPPGTFHPTPDIADKMMSCVLRTIWGLRGPLAVLMSGWSWLTSGKMHAVIVRRWWPKKFVPATPRAVEEDERLKAIEELWMHGDKAWGPHRTQLSHALKCLREAFALVSQLTLSNTFPHMTAVPYSIDDETISVLTDRGSIFVWVTHISREFITLIEKKDLDALVILAHYAILPGRVRNVWWLEGLGANFITAVAMALGREYWELIAWPANVLGVDLENGFGARKDSLEGMPDEMHMDVI